MSITKPTTDPSWATDAKYPAGSDPWSGQPTRSAPSSGKRGTGYVPGTDDAAEEDNDILGVHGDYIDYLRNALCADKCGDGSDGDVTLDGVATYAFMSLSGSTYTLTRDVFLDNLTVNVGVRLKVGGFRWNVRDTCTNNGKIDADGNPGSGTTRGFGANSNTVAGGPQGGDGASGAGAGNAGSNSSTSTGYGGNGGAGGTVSIDAGGAGGVASHGAATGGVRALFNILTGFVFTLSGGGPAFAIFGGGGGGGGASLVGGTGGGGGAGGGVNCGAARKLINNGTISADGGAGAPGTGASEGCGGGGGGGGYVGLFAGEMSGSGTITANGGLGGAGTGGSTNPGANGSNGIVALIDLTTVPG